MELVSTSKLKRAQDRVVGGAALRRGAGRGHRGSLVTPGAGGAVPAAAAPGAAGQGRAQSRGRVILITSNRGLWRRVQLQPDQGSAPADRGARGRGVRGRPVRRRQEGHRVLQVSRAQARRWSGSTSATGRPRSTPPRSSTPLIAAFAAGKLASVDLVQARFSARSRRRRRRCGSCRSSRPRREPAGRATTSSRRAPRRFSSSCCRSTCGTWSIAGWWRPRRRSTARAGPR